MINKKKFIVALLWSLLIFSTCVGCLITSYAFWHDNCTDARILSRWLIASAVCLILSVHVTIGTLFAKCEPAFNMFYIMISMTILISLSIVGTSSMVGYLKNCKRVNLWIISLCVVIIDWIITLIYIVKWIIITKKITKKGRYILIN